MKKHKKTEQFLEQLRLIPNISVACEKVGISRNSIYKWRENDPIFRERMDRALRLGVESVNDLAESHLVQKIKSGDMRAITYWLGNKKKDYLKPKPPGYLKRMFGGDGIRNPARDILIELGLVSDSDGVNGQELSEKIKNLDDPDIKF